MENREQTNYIVVHAAFTKKAMDIGVVEITRWHKERGFSDIGYHYVITRTGEVQIGRALHFKGAHAIPVNSESVAICLVGGKSDDGESWEHNYTIQQLNSLKALVLDLLFLFPDAEVVGHKDVQDKRKCPGFDIASLFENDIAVEEV